MGIPINFNDPEVKSFEALEGGTYDFVVYDGKVDKAGPNAKNPGATVLVWELNITGPGNFGERIPKVWLRHTLVPTSLGIVKRDLKALGYTDEQLNADGFEIDVDDVIGRRGQAVLTKDEEYGNNKVKKLLPARESSSVLP